MTDKKDDVIEPSAEEQSMENFLDEFRETESKMTVYREDPTGQRSKRAFLFNRPARDYTMPEVLEYIRDNHGGGDFTIEVRGKLGKFEGSRRVSIEAPKSVLPAEMAAPAAAAPASPLPETSNELAGAFGAVMERAAQQSHDNMMVMIEALKASRPEPVDPAMLQQNFLAQITAIKELFGDERRSTGTDVDDWLKMFGLARELVGGGSGESNGFDVLRSAVSNLAPMLIPQLGAGLMPPVPPSFAGAPNQPAAQPPLATAPAATDPGQTADTPAPMPSAEEQQQQVARFQYLLGELLDCAARNLDPFTYAAVAVDKLGADMAYNVFHEQLDGLAQQVPQIAEHRGWFDELATCIDEVLQDAAADAAAAHQEPGHVPNGGEPANTDGHSADGDPRRPGGDPGDPAADGKTGEPGEDAD